MCMCVTPEITFPGLRFTWPGIYAWNPVAGEQQNNNCTASGPLCVVLTYDVRYAPSMSVKGTENECGKSKKWREWVGSLRRDLCDSSRNSHFFSAQLKDIKASVKRSLWLRGEETAECGTPSSAKGHSVSPRRQHRRVKFREIIETVHVLLVPVSVIQLCENLEEGTKYFRYLCNFRITGFCFLTRIFVFSHVVDQAWLLAFNLNVLSKTSKIGCKFAEEHSGASLSVAGQHIWLFHLIEPSLLLLSTLRCFTMYIWKMCGIYILKPSENNFYACHSYLKIYACIVGCIHTCIPVQYTECKLIKTHKLDTASFW